MSPRPHFTGSETSSLTGYSVSICASVACSFKPGMKQRAIRSVTMSLWVVLYLTYTCLFGIRLKSWNDDVPGHCYNGYKIAQPNALHPKVDFVYVSLTCSYVFISLGWALGLGRLYGFSESYSEYLVLICAALQFPLHVYSIFTLRANNEGLLSAGSTEREWGFGQIVAMMLLAPNIMTLVTGFQGHLFTHFHAEAEFLLTTQIRLSKVAQGQDSTRTAGCCMTRELETQPVENNGQCLWRSMSSLNCHAVVHPPWLRRKARVRTAERLGSCN